MRWITISVIDMFEDSPSYKAGLKVGDIILKVDGESYEIISKNGYNQLDMSPYVGTLGTHSVSMYATVDKYTSPTIKFNLVITSTTELYLSTTFVNGSEYTYGVPISINYRLSKKSTELFDVYIFLDDVLEKTEIAFELLKFLVNNYNKGVSYWKIKSSVISTYILNIVCLMELAE